MKIKTIVFLVIIFGLVLGIGIFGKPHIPTQASKQGGHHDIWYCPMHPHYTSDRPGKCPICGMDLVKEEVPQELAPVREKSSSLPDYVPISVSPQKQQLIGVRTAIVTKKTVTKTIRAAGRVAYDPDLYKAEVDYVEDYIAYIRLNRRINSGSYAIQDAQRKLKEAELDLSHMGATQQTISQLQQNQFPDHSLLVSHHGGGQVFAEVFAEDLGFIDVGQKAIIEIPDYAKNLEGVVQSIDPIIDSASQTARVRIQVNTDRKLYPNIFALIQFPVELNEAIVISREAVMDTGIRKIVFVQKDEGLFEPREIKTGWETDDGFEVTSGLKEGERIVISGNFLLDSESGIQAVLEQGDNNG